MEKTIFFRNSLTTIQNIYDLERLGAGHDGFVFRFEDKALKLLKYDFQQRKEKGLMTFEKANYFQQELQLKRITQPVDVLLDIDGNYAGYAMDFLYDVIKSEEKNIGDFTCEELVISSRELEEDFNLMTKKGVKAKDINRGSYIISSDFLHLCDMDKYEMFLQPHKIEDLNKSALNFAIAKILYYEILKLTNVDNQERKKLLNWVKRNSNSRNFINYIESEIGNEKQTPISEYAKHLSKQLINK